MAPCAVALPAASGVLRCGWRAGTAQPLFMQLGTYYGKYGEDVFNIDAEKHTAIFGKSGTGKSTLLRNMILADIQAGKGVTVEDPHGDLIDSILPSIPPPRLRDVIFFDPLSLFPIGINIFNSRNEQKAIDSLTSIISTVWETGWGPQSDFICTNLARALFAYKRNATVIYLDRLLSSQAFRRKVFRNAGGDLLDFFHTIDDKQTGWDSRQRENAFAPLRNKANKFVANPLLRLTMGQERGLDFSEVISKKAILLCRLSKGACGSDVSSLLGSVIVTMLVMAAMEQESKPWEQRVPHALYMDEVQSFTKGIPLDVILAEARKYRLNLTVATQTVSQLPEGSEAAVFGNCTSLLTYRVSGEDAKTLALEFGDEFPASALLKLQNFEFYGKTVREGIPIEPAKVRAFSPARVKGAPKKSVLNWSATKHGTPRDEVERKLQKFLGG